MPSRGDEQADKRLADRWPIMEAEALSTYTAALQDEPEAIDPEGR